MKPLVTVITPVYATPDNGRLESLKRCIDSFKDEIVPYEHIIVDDGSTVDIHDALDLHLEQHVKVIKTEHIYDLDPGTAYRTALRASDGVYGLVMGSDDVLVKGGLWDLTEEFKNRNFLVAGCAINVMEDGSEQKFVPDTQNALARSLTSCIFHCCATMFDINMAIEMDAFPSYAYHAGDWDLWMKLCECGPVRSTDSVVCRYNVSGFKKTLNKNRKDRAISDIQLMALRRRGIPTE